MSEPAKTAAEVFAKAQARFRPEKAVGVAGVCEFKLTGDGGGTYTVEIADGKFLYREAATANAAVHVTVGAELFVRLATGDADAFTALATGRLKIDGDKDLAYKLSGLFF